MTIGFDGINPEQVKLEPERLAHDVESLEPGRGAWVSIEALWADLDGNLFIAGDYILIHDSEISDIDSEEEYYQTDDIVYVFIAMEGVIVSVAHASPETISAIRIDSHTKPNKELVDHSLPVCGFITDILTLQLVNNDFLSDYEERIPESMPCDVD